MFGVLRSAPAANVCLFVLAGEAVKLILCTCSLGRLCCDYRPHHSVVMPKANTSCEIMAGHHNRNVDTVIGYMPGQGNGFSVSVFNDFTLL